ncbi:hypothetical protein [Klebsiella pneumoniae IS46]|nr:hypothetical protein [Klebsiella pneumoniae IS46]
MSVISFWLIIVICRTLIVRLLEQITYRFFPTIPWLVFFHQKINK